MKFVFADGEKIGVFEDGKKILLDSTYIKRYRENTLRDAKNKEWKKSTDLMFEDDYYFNMQDDTEVVAAIHGVALTCEKNKIAYSFTVNGTSGLYYKYIDDKEKTEAHMISSKDVEFNAFSTTEGGDMLGSIQTDSISSKIAVFSKEGGDYKCLTEGDSLDENPSFDINGNILFNSYAVGRDANNNFIAYMPSEIYRLDVENMVADVIVTDGKYSYIKPMMDNDGNLYCIRKPGVEKEEGNAFIEILLIPFRILQAIAGFIAAFVMCFAKRPMVKGQSARSIGNGEMARNGKGDPKKIFVNNNLINVDKELKKNKKSEDYGFIPRSWKLVRLEPNERGGFEDRSEYEIASGVADYCIVNDKEEKTLVYTNGKHVFEVKDFGKEGKRKKLFDTDFCLKVGSLQPHRNGDPFAEENGQSDGLFDRL